MAPSCQYKSMPLINGVGYDDTVWDLNHNKNIEWLEMIQHRAIRFISRLKGQANVADDNSELRLYTLQQRR